MHYLIDAHCHLTDERVWGSARDWILSAQKAGVKKVRIGGLEPAEWSRQLELQKEFPDFITTSFGLHPWWIEKKSRAEIEGILKELESRAPLSQGIGETGLDFFQKRDPARFADQEFAFRTQIQIAKTYQLPLILHVVKAHTEAIQILREEQAESLPLQVHSFSGSAEIAKEWLKLGAYLSFSGTFLRENAQKLRQVLKETPASQLLLETDSPDQAWREDGRNEPQFIQEVYEKAAQVLDLKTTTLAEIVAENFKRFE